MNATVWQEQIIGYVGNEAASFFLTVLKIESPILEYSIIFCGRESSDVNSRAMPSENMGLYQITQKDVTMKAVRKSRLSEYKQCPISEFRR